MFKYITAALVLMPAIALAQTTNWGPLGTFLTNVSELVGWLIPFLVMLAGLIFMWGLVKYIMNASDEAAKESAKTLMIWGMIAILIMVSFWAIIGFFSESINVNGTVVSGTTPEVTGVVTLP